jgi:hypothetical protein
MNVSDKFRESKIVSNLDQRDNNYAVVLWRSGFFPYGERIQSCSIHDYFESEVA